MLKTIKIKNEKNEIINVVELEDVLKVMLGLENRNGVKVDNIIDNWNLLKMTLRELIVKNKQEANK